MNAGESWPLMMVMPASAPAAARARPAPDFGRATPPPGISTTLTAVCVLGCLVAVMLFMHGGSTLFGG